MLGWIAASCGSQHRKSFIEYFSAAVDWKLSLHMKINVFIGSREVISISGVLVKGKEYDLSLLSQT